MTSLIQPIVLVTGGTGRQGGATVDQLLAAGKVRVRALARDPRSDKARKLAARGVEVVRGDLTDPASLRAALSGASAAFSAQTFTGKGGIAGEERQGKAFADAVKAAGDVHLVYSSVDGAERNSGVPHFESKWRVEQHIEKLGLNATILRPTAFMENFATAAFPRSMFLGMMTAVIGADTKVQWVSVADVGWFAARALEMPERHAGRKIAIAGDDLSVRDIAEAYRAASGKAARPAPIPGFLPRLMLPEDIYLMLRWFGEHGYQADIGAIRSEHPQLRSFKAWLVADGRNAGRRQAKAPQFAG